MSNDADELREESDAESTAAFSSCKAANELSAVALKLNMLCQQGSAF